MRRGAGDEGDEVVQHVGEEPGEVEGGGPSGEGVVAPGDSSTSCLEDRPLK